MKKGFLLVCSLLILLCLLPALALSWGRSVTFVNHSGEEALVKLVCPAGQTKQITIPNGSNGTLDGLNTGTYFIKIRYGQVGNYRYSKGDQFTLQYNHAGAQITLHPVVGGNYGARPISAAEFNQ